MSTSPKVESAPWSGSDGHRFALDDRPGGAGLNGRYVLAATFSVIGALSYCSWPLGLVLNPDLARTGLASDLEAHSQPFSWLFIGLDCVSGCAVVIVALLLWDRATPAAERTRRVLLLIGYAMFGVATAVDALIPFGCGSTSIRSCSASLSHLSVDDYLTGLAVFALFVAVADAQLQAVRAVGWHVGTQLSLGVIVVWCACGLGFLSVHFSTVPAVTLQHVFLTLSSVVVLVVPALFVRAIGVHASP